jgi:hypothetical protein
MTRYRDGYKYQLDDDIEHWVPIVPQGPVIEDFIELRPQSFALNRGSVLTVRKGYAWDGASGPTRDTPSSITPSAVHDALYQLMRKKLLASTWRPTVDKVFYQMLIGCGMWKWRAKLWYRGVRLGAGFAADPANAKKVKVAP